MKGELSTVLIGKFVLMLVGLGLGAALLTQMMGGAGPEDPAVRTVEQANYPICAEYDRGEEVDRQDFKILLYARHKEKCDTDENVVDMGFTLTTTELKRFARTFNIQNEDGTPRLLYLSECRDIEDFNGIIIGRQEPVGDTDALFRPGDEITFRQSDRGVMLCPDF